MQRCQSSRRMRLIDSLLGCWQERQDAFEQCQIAAGCYRVQRVVCRHRLLYRCVGYCDGQLDKVVVSVAIVLVRLSWNRRCAEF